MAKEWGVIVTDIQGDFTEWKKGSFAVPGSDEYYVKRAETATRRLKEVGALIFGTQDWHPSDHVSFASSHPGKKAFETITIGGRTRVLWPPHCVRGTENARVLIDNDLFLAIVKKAQDPAVESYSAFQDENGAPTEMGSILKFNGVKKVIVYGIATDYCVRTTALDLSAAGYVTTVIEGLCRGVAPDTSAAALDEMRRKGIRVVTTPDEIIEEIRKGPSSDPPG
jgi:nicotinamidase/pyrazinamidase